MKILVILTIVMCIYIYARTFYMMYHVKRRPTTFELFTIGFIPVLGCLLWMFYKDRKKNKQRKLLNRLKYY